MTVEKPADPSRRAEKVPTLTRLRDTDQTGSSSRRGHPRTDGRIPIRREILPGGAPPKLPPLRHAENAEVGYGRP